MKKEIGSTRRVFIFKSIVIKVARIYWLNSIKTIKNSLFYNIELMRGGFHYYFQKKHEEKENTKNLLGDFEESRIEKEKRRQMKVLYDKSYEMYDTVSFYLFSGIMANYHEWQFYRQTKNCFVVPTYFSFFGLFNIQKRGNKIDFWDEYGVWEYIYKNSKNPNQPLCDGHTLSSTKNYCIDNGKLKLVDYGDRQVAEFLKINGENLCSNFKRPD